MARLVRTGRPAGPNRTPIIYRRNPANFMGLRQFGSLSRKVMDPRTGFWQCQAWLAPDDFGVMSDVRGNGLDINSKLD